MVKSIFYAACMLVFFFYSGAVWGGNLGINGNFEAGNANWSEWSNMQFRVHHVFEHDYAAGSDAGCLILIRKSVSLLTPVSESG